MTAAPVEARIWPRRRWWLLIALIFAGQLVFIFGLSDRNPLKVRRPASAPILVLGSATPTELLALSDPTLFALPHRQGFSAPVWVVSPPRNPRPVPTHEPLVYLELPN